MSRASRSVWTVAALGLTACTASLEGSADGQGGPSAPLGGSAGFLGGDSGTSTTAATDPGRVTLHRLNRAEYNNTVRDLLGTASRPADAFPIDDRGDGFDNMADLLTLSPLHLSTYGSAAKALVSEALGNPARRGSIITCDPVAQGDACAREILKNFAYLAWRRPVADAETERLLSVVSAARSRGETYDAGLALALRAVLLSPYFIFRVELDPEPSSLSPHPLSGFELAARLAYFLWSSTPDAALLSSAASGALAEPTQLADQLSRLLTDERASALVDNFAGQWLHLRAIDALAPDAATFANFDLALLGPMKQEAELLFHEVAFQGAPVTTLLTANHSYMNDSLAIHYGLSPLGSTELLRVDLTGNAQRGGFLTQAGFLTLTSHPERTSPVLRGKWVMEELLCAGVPPPPPNVDLAGLATAKAQGLTQRQALEQHRQDPQCRSCHQLMDPIGFGLENYDAIGAYRTIEAGSAIDASGQLPSGEPFSGAKQLGQLLAAKPDFARCVASKLYSYALGRPPSTDPGHLDAATLTGIVQAFVGSGYSWRELLSRIVQSPTFTSRRGEPAPGGAP